MSAQQQSFVPKRKLRYCVAQYRRHLRSQSSGDRLSLDFALLKRRSCEVEPTCHSELQFLQLLGQGRFADPFLA